MNQLDAYNLFHEGTKALGIAERNGMRVDVRLLDATIDKEGGRCSVISSELDAMVEGRQWKEKYGSNSSYLSPQQLTVILKNYGLTIEKADKAVLSKIESPFVRKILELRKISKMIASLTGFKREVTNDERIHPSFHLHGVSSYRSSSSNPNFQNIAIRDPETAERIRSLFIPTSGYRLLEVDYCFTGDTQIETTGGRKTLKEIVEKQDLCHVYGYDKDKGRVCVSRIIRAAKTQTSQPVFTVTLDNGETAKATANHRFMLRDGSYRELRSLRPGDSLMPFYTTTLSQTNIKTKYRWVYLNNGEKMKAHNLVALDVLGYTIKGSYKIVHHRNGNGWDNDPSNLVVMDRKEHMSIHSKQGWENTKNGAEHKRQTYQRSAEGRAEQSIRSKRIHDETPECIKREWYKHISESHKGLYEGSKNPMYGKKHKIETVEKIRATKKRQNIKSFLGRTHSMETRLLLSAKNKGKKLTEVIKRKISASGKGRICKEETRKLLRERVFTESTRMKMGKGIKERWKKAKTHSCPICKKEYRSLSGIPSTTHLRHKHGLTTEEFKDTYNHKVVSVDFYGYEDVYNITVDRIHNYALKAGVIVANCGIEVRASTFYNKDPVLINYILDKTTDMHKDMASECYMLPKDKVTKEIRYCAKNMFVFPAFYGSYYKQIAPHLWNAIGDMKLKLSDGTDLASHVAARIGDRNDFMAHIQKVENAFWNDRFKVYTQWKKDFYSKYLERGYFDSLTGFRYKGEFKRNQVLNYAIQGTAFHCLLWSFIELTKEFIKNKWKSKVIGQIHDSIITEIHDSEFEAYKVLIKDIMTRRVVQAFPFINVPLEVEIEAAGVDESWHKKKAVK